MSSLSILDTRKMEQLIMERLPQGWTVPPDCMCRTVGGVGVVNDVKSPILEYPVTGGALPGLTAEETAILAGVLAGLAALLFLALPILCCLCPLPLCCPCCFGAGRGKKGAGAAGAAGGHKTANLRRNGSYGTDIESFWSKGSWDKMDYENLYGVDMKLPRPWVDSLRGIPNEQFDAKLKELEKDGWEGIDIGGDHRDGVGRSEGMEAMAQSGEMVYAGRGGDSRLNNSSFKQGGAVADGEEEVITEYAQTRRIDVHIGRLNEEEIERYYEKEYAQDFSKDNFMKIYQSYRKMLDGSSRNGHPF